MEFIAKMKDENQNSTNEVQRQFLKSQIDEQHIQEKIYRDIISRKFFKQNRKQITKRLSKNQQNNTYCNRKLSIISQEDKNRTQFFDNRIKENFKDDSPYNKSLLFSFSENQMLGSGYGYTIFQR